MSKAEIFKYQRSQFPDRSRCFVYNRTLSVQGEFDLEPEIAALFDEYGEKFYAMGKYNVKTGKVMIHDLAPQQAW